MVRRVLALLVCISTVSTVVAGARVLAAGEPETPLVRRVVATPEPTPTPEPTLRPTPVPPTARPTPDPTPAPTPPPPPPPTPRPEPGVNARGADDTALLIGINKAPGSQALEGSLTDVRNMRTALINQGFEERNIKTLTDKNATRGAILWALDSFARRTSGKGNAVFLLSTHSGESGGDLTFATGGGGRISRHELADRLAKVPGKLWSMLPTCYSKGYALPGVVGKNRIAVFSSKEDEFSWQLGSAGSWLVLYMIDYGILRGDASAETVEDAFRWTKSKLLVDAPHRAPILSDGVRGEMPLNVDSRY